MLEYVGDACPAAREVQDLTTRAVVLWNLTSLEIARVLGGGGRLPLLGNGSLYDYARSLSKLPEILHFRLDYCPNAM